MAQLKVTWKRSSIGFPRGQKETLKALGFKKLQQVVVKEDNPSIRGMIQKVGHLVDVEQI